jgi:hypothetical protein
MPLVRIDLPQSIDADWAQKIGETINKAMMEVISVPNGDKFQVVTRHPPEGRNLTSEYLGIRYSNNLVLLQITLNQGSDSGAEKAFRSKSPRGTGRSEMINCPAQFAAVCLETFSSPKHLRRGVASNHRIVLSDWRGR